MAYTRPGTSSRKNPYDPAKDALRVEVGFFEGESPPRSTIYVRIYRYDGGPPRIHVARMIYDRGSRLGRVTANEARLLAGLMLDAAGRIDREEVE